MLNNPWKAPLNGAWALRRGLGLGLLVGMVAFPSFADTIYLKNNRQLIGIIEPSTTDADKVVIRTRTGTIPVPLSNIERIEREDKAGFTESAADIAASNDELDRAMQLYRRALQDEPENEGLKAKMAALRGRIEERDQRAYGIYLGRIKKYLDNQQFEEAIEEVDKSISRTKEPSAKKRYLEMLAQAHVGLARNFVDRVDYPKAEGHYTKAMQAYPEAPLAYLELAEMMQLSPARKAAAIPLYQKGIELAQSGGELIEPEKLLEYRFKLGQLYEQGKNYGRAAEIFLTVARDDKNYAFPQAADLAIESYTKHQSSGDAGSAQSEEIEQIIENLEALIEHRPDDERAYLLLGRIYFDRSNWDEARKHLSAAVLNSAASGPNLAMQEALYFLGISHRRMGDNEQAALVFQNLVNQKVATYEVFCELVEIRLEQAAYQQAIELFEQALVLDPDKYRAYMGQGDTLEKRRQYGPARQRYQEVVARDPSNQRARLEIAKTCLNEEFNYDAVREATPTSLRRC